ncbi:chromosome segregation DNA-binding protein [Georgenia satyanarayanai]|uniref:Chromosome segregation DNA-binding protein n=1 Tax=Georgenia satyanarayanai TaxID=860221 RepID=A0A2Y9C7G2_9MICO|nr:ParB/RepB/Spo0J family partition protein [Georgenia satyanarayanai]PYF97743.1 chromosome segregation DNA-binding protein [Georgenia satyanarayanai]SSA45483.1 chromosome segregation DNA-binding protein [Georgenia satyanarayanai]
MTEKRRGLGKGLGALIPTAPAAGRPVDVFFPDQRTERSSRAPQAPVTEAAEAPPAPARDSTPRTSRTTSATTTKTAGKTRKRASIPKDTVTPRRGSGPGAPTADTPAAAGSAEGPPSTQAPPAEEAVTPEQPAAASPAEAASEDSLVPVPGATFAEIPVDEVVANRRQPRQVFDEDELEELAASIREVGVLQPIVVRALPEGEEARYELIMGERRWRASQLAGNATVPAIIREVEDDALLRDALLENLHRAQLNPLEEAAAYQQLLEDFSCTHEELASRIARSRPQISNTLRLLKLPPLVQRRVAAGILSAGHARALLGLSDPAAMERLAQRIVAEGLSVRTTEEIVALGDEPTAPEMRRRPRTGTYTAELNEIATRLSDRFDTRVKIGMGQRKGKINIEFASIEDLNRILDVLAPSVERPPLEDATS